MIIIINISTKNRCFCYISQWSIMFNIICTSIFSHSNWFPINYWTKWSIQKIEMFYTSTGYRCLKRYILINEVRSIEYTCKRSSRTKILDESFPWRIWVNNSKRSDFCGPLKRLYFHEKKKKCPTEDNVHVTLLNKSVDLSDANIW